MSTIAHYRGGPRHGETEAVEGAPLEIMVAVPSAPVMRMLAEATDPPDERAPFLGRYVRALNPFPYSVVPEYLYRWAGPDHWAVYAGRHDVISPTFATRGEAYDWFREHQTTCSCFLDHSLEVRWAPPPQGTEHRSV